MRAAFTQPRPWRTCRTSVLVLVIADSLTCLVMSPLLRLGCHPPLAVAHILGREMGTVEVADLLVGFEPPIKCPLKFVQRSLFSPQAVDLGGISFTEIRQLAVQV